MKIYWLTIICIIICLSSCKKENDMSVPNILFVISDDQSYPHTSAYGCNFVQTPAFDRIASEGILFENCFAAAPSCSPSRAAILTGKNIWQLEEAATQNGYFPAKFTTFTEILSNNGYLVGYTGKPWSPGKWKGIGWEDNPVGKSYSRFKLNPPTKGISTFDYFENFRYFLSKREEGQPFFFWCGFIEPHRPYEYGSGITSGLSQDSLNIPEFLCDDERTRNDILDYALEIEWEDKQLQKIVSFLEETGEIDNTIIVVTSDNGMPFPRAKIHVYEYGIHVPLAIKWNDKIKPGRLVNDFIGFNDFAPTFLELAGIRDSLPEMSGDSFVNILFSKKNGLVDKSRNFVLSGKERHGYCRPDILGYPSRILRTNKYLYIRNFKPNRYPSGDPDLYRDGHIDTPSGLSIMEYKKEDSLANRNFHLLVDKRASEELYNIVQDPECIHDLADDKQYFKIKEELREKLEEELSNQKDPRIFEKGDVFDSYPIFTSASFFDEKGNKLFPGFSERGEYNPNLK